MWFRRFAPAVVLTVGWVSFSTAQFDADQSGVGQSTTVQSSGPDELVRQLRSLASRGGDDRARATASLIRVGAWTEAASQLEKIGEEKDNAVVASSARTIGAALLLRVSLREEMTEAAQKAIEKMSQMLDQSDQAPEKLTAAIAALANSSVDQNLAANRTLLRGGKAAIVEMVKAIGQGLPQQQFEKVVQVLKRFGQEGTDAVGELALYGNANVRANALVAYQSLADREMALAWSFAARFASNATAAEVEVGKRLTSGHSAGDALVYLLDRLRQLRRDALRTPNDQSPATMWAIAEEASSVSASRSTELYRCYRKAYDLAQQIRRLPNLTPDALRNVIAADLPIGSWLTWTGVMKAKLMP
ncbi:hypothetical protein C2E31_03145 [Rhodopirellula baltica]|nr:hypothetical protein C2E31_03145 [Rhodopirellula baltica]